MMDWLWVCGGIFSVWAVLRVIGAERQRRMHELIVQIAVQQAEEPVRRPTRPGAAIPPPAGTAAPTPAVRSNATR